MVNTDHSSANVCAAEVIDRQVRTPLVFVLEPAEAFGFARLFVPRELEKYGFSKL
jgi:hypothetical protein